MAFDPKNTDVFQLLEKLKGANGAYPPDLFAARRQGYLKQIAQIGGGAGLALALKETAKAAKGVGTGLPSAAASTVLEAILVVAIVAEAGAVGYFYRDKLVELYQRLTGSGSPKVEQVVNPPVPASPIPGVELTPTPVMTETATPTDSATAFVEQATHSGTGGQAGPSQDASQPAVSTPAASENNNNKGNHYGNTPIPERTKDPGNSTSDSSTDQTTPKKKP